MCIIVLNFVVIGGKNCQDMTIYLYYFNVPAGSHLEPVMCIIGPPTNFIIMQNPVGMDAVLLIIRKF